jgi:hypothetical protein
MPAGELSSQLHGTLGSAPAAALWQKRASTSLLSLGMLAVAGLF